MIFCGVFDGHGPMGHKISRHICDNLPSRVYIYVSREDEFVVLATDGVITTHFNEFSVFLTNCIK